MESRDRRDAVAHLSASSGPAGGGRSRGQAVVCVGERADGWGYTVSDCVRERERVQRVGRLEPKLSGPASVAQCVFPFFFYGIYDVYICFLYNKLSADPKIMKIFV